MTNVEHPRASGTDASVKDYIAATQASAARLPHDEVAAAGGHFSDAANAAARAGEASHAPVVSRLHEAAGHAAAGVAILHDAAAEVADYVQFVTGQGGGGAPAVSGTHNSPSAEAPKPHRVKSPLTVETRRSGGVEYTFALSQHTPDNAATVANAVRGCDIILLERAGAQDEATRQQTMVNYSKLTSDTIDPAILEQILADNPDDFGYALLAQLAGTNKQVIPIDITKDNPAYATVEAFEAALEELHLDAFIVAPVEHVQRRFADFAAAAAAANSARDAIMAQQVVQTHPYIAQQAPGAKVGVVMGAAHYGVIERTGLNTPEQADKTRQRVERTVAPSTQAVLEVSKGGQPTQETVDRAVLAYYADVLPVDNDRATELALQLDDEQVSDALRHIDSLWERHPETNDRRAAATEYINGLIARHQPERRAVSVHIDEV